MPVPVLTQTWRDHRDDFPRFCIVCDSHGSQPRNEGTQKEPTCNLKLFGVEAPVGERTRCTLLDSHKVNAEHHNEIPFSITVEGRLLTGLL